MGFTNFTESSGGCNHTPADLAQKKKELQNELQSLLNQIVEAEKGKIDIKKTEEAIKKTREILDIAKKESSDAEKAAASEKGILAQVQSEIEEGKAVAAAVADDIKAQLEVNSNLIVETNVLKNTFFSYEKKVSEIKKVFDEETAKNDASLESGRGELKDLHSKLFETKNELETFESKKKASEQAVEDTKIELEQKNIELVEAGRNLEQIKSQIPALEKEAEKIRFDADTYREEQEADVLKKITALEQREGTLSLKESWNREKEENLRQIKAELEKHLGKQINIII